MLLRHPLPPQPAALVGVALEEVVGDVVVDERLVAPGVARDRPVAGAHDAPGDAVELGQRPVDVVVGQLGAEEVPVPVGVGGELGARIHQPLAHQQPQRRVEVVPDPAAARRVADGRLDPERVQPPARERVPDVAPEPTGRALVHPLQGMGLYRRRCLAGPPLGVHRRHDLAEVRHGVVELPLQLVHEAEGLVGPLPVPAGLVAVPLHGRQAHPPAFRRRPLEVHPTPPIIC